jgi:hypothetical protein
MFAALAPAASAAFAPAPPPRGRTVRAVAFVAHPRHRRVAARASFAASTPPSRPGLAPLRVSSGRATFARRLRASRSVARAAAGDAADDAFPAPPTFVGAPMDPGSAHGQMLAHVLDNESHLFTAAVEATLDRMSEELDADEQRQGSVDVTADEDDTAVTSRSASAAANAPSGADGGLVLFRRIQAMRASERRNGVQDVMYANILQKFRGLNVDMLPPLDEEMFDVRGVDLTRLTDGVHSAEALSMVKEHLMGMLGPEANAAYGNALVRTSKLQAAQMYAASIMFGYFLRKADKRFSLDRAMGTLPLNPEESARSLEALFESASAMDSVDEADLGLGGDARGRPSASERSDDIKIKTNASEGKLTLKQYIQSFDAATLAETARVVSLEGVVLAERQTGALFGSVETLAREMQSALEEGGEPITSPEELMRRVEDVVGGGKVATVTLPVATQRRVVLEAVAFGSFLRDAEAFVDARDGRLLTPAPRRRGPPGMLGGGEGPDGGARV